MKTRGIRVGIMTLTDPRPSTINPERERYNESKHRELAKFLRAQKFEVIDPLEPMRRRWKKYFGLYSTKEVARCADALKKGGAECLIVGCWHWTEPQLMIQLVRETGIPTLLYSESNPLWAGSVCISAVGASLWEAPVNESALRHHRIMGQKDQITAWIRGVGALQRMRRGSLLLCGGTYCLRMEHLQDDIPFLKSFLIGDVLNEGEYILIKRAEKIEKKQPKRLEQFVRWLVKNNAKIKYDDTMLTSESLRKQIALLLAARDRLEELNGENIIGFSIRCQPELSEEYGFTPCLLPSFLPFGEGPEGPTRIVPTVCEGDIKGLITCALLHQIRPEVPPLFGDLKHVENGSVVISNCGGASVYYAAFSNKASRVLPCVTISGQCQGKAGGAVGYFSPEGEITVARLVRIDGEYILQLGIGKIRDSSSFLGRRSVYAPMWPTTIIELGVDEQLFVRAVGSNHLCASIGDLTAELIHASRQAGIPIVRIDSNAGMEAFLESL